MLCGPNSNPVLSSFRTGRIKGKRSRERQLKSWKDGLRERVEELGPKDQLVPRTVLHVSLFSLVGRTFDR